MFDILENKNVALNETVASKLLRSSASTHLFVASPVEMYCSSSFGLFILFAQLEEHVAY